VRYRAVRSPLHAARLQESRESSIWSLADSLVSGCPRGVLDLRVTGPPAQRGPLTQPHVGIPRLARTAWRGLLQGRNRLRLRRMPSCSDPPSG
jgi:hypothetical protein